MQCLPMGSYPAEAVASALPGLPDWRVIVRHLRTRYQTGNFSAGLELVNRVAEIAEAANHHPDVELGYGQVEFCLFSHDVGELTSRDVDLAKRISAIAAELGIPADPAAVSRLELALDTHDADQILPFWQAVLRMAPHPSLPMELVDPSGHLPNLWFQQCPPHGVPDQRFHLDLWVPVDEVTSRISAGVAAGGVIISTEQAPDFTVLADLQGNKVCVCTVPN